MMAKVQLAHSFMTQGFQMSFNKVGRIDGVERSLAAGEQGRTPHESGLQAEAVFAPFCLYTSPFILIYLLNAI